MKSLIIALLFVSACSTAPEVNLQNIEEYQGYITNERTNPLVFITDSDSLMWIHEYDFNPRLVRVERTIYVRKDGNRNIVVADKFK